MNKKILSILYKLNNFLILYLDKENEKESYQTNTYQEENPLPIQDNFKLDLLSDWIGINYKNLDLRMGNMRLYIIKLVTFHEYNTVSPSLTNFKDSTFIVEVRDVEGKRTIVSYSIRDLSSLMKDKIVIDINGFYEQEISALFN